MATFLPTINYDCGNSYLITWIIYGLVFLIAIMGFFIILIRKIILIYEEIERQNEVLKRDLELNAILKHEHIQKLLCPHDLVTFNDEHVYSCDKCSACNKHCKKECWTQYFIEKLKEEQSTH